MNSGRKILTRHLLLIAAALTPGTLLAATTTADLTVQATVVDACTVSGATLDFGSVDPIAGAPVAATNTTNISVTCSLLTPYSIRLGPGSHGDGSVTGRTMLVTGGGTDELAYSLFRDSAGTLNWGETDTTDTVDLVGTGLAVPTAVYGTIAAGQAVPAGSYTDTVTITVSY